MFKYFSLKGVLHTIKKYWLVICALTVIFAVIGAVMPVSVPSIEGSGEKYTSTRSYLVSSVDSSLKTADSENNDANLLVAVLCDSSCQYKILQRIQEDYSNSEISEFMGVPAAKNYSPKIFEGLLSISRALNSSVINICFTSSNKDFSESIISYYSEYIEENSGNLFEGSSTVRPLNEVITSHDSSDIGDTPIPSGTNIKNIVIFALLGAVLCICAAAVIALIVPPIADVKGFEEYGFKVYCKNILRNRNKLEFVEDIIKRDIANCGYKQVAVISSNEKQKQRVLELLETFEIEGAEFINIENVTENFEAFSKLKKCDATILVETEGRTTYNNFEKLISLLAKYDLNVMGIILR